MGLPGAGCCCGVIVGMILAVLLSCAAAFGIYCYFNPEARETTVVVIEKKWDKVKSGGDEIIDKAKSLPAEPDVSEIFD